MPRLSACVRCGEPAVRVYCSRRCANIASNQARQIRAADDARVQRRHRVADAPGLTEYGIRKLVTKWVKQDRICTYCPSRATTADHVLPLVRGGTNYEGNLTPCCKACNSRKSGHTVIEWRTGLRLPPMTTTLDTMGRRRPARTPKPTPPRPDCRVCGGACPAPRRTVCSEDCRAIDFRNYMRARYRRLNGIPTDAPPYTRAA